MRMMRAPGWLQTWLQFTGVSWVLAAILFFLAVSLRPTLAEETSAGDWPQWQGLHAMDGLSVVAQAWPVHQQGMGK